MDFPILIIWMCPLSFLGHQEYFSFLFNFLVKILSANRIALDGRSRLAASHLGLFCLPMSHKKMPGLYGLS